MTGRLAGKHAVVTGAAGGIGSVAARAFAAEGATVGWLDWPGPGLESLRAEAETGGGLLLAADLTDEQSVGSAFAEWADRFGVSTSSTPPPGCS